MDRKIYHTDMKQKKVGTAMMSNKINTKNITGGIFQTDKNSIF